MTNWLNLWWVESISIQSLLRNYADIKYLYDNNKITLVDLMKMEKVVIEEIERRISEK